MISNVGQKPHSGRVLFGLPPKPFMAFFNSFSSINTIVFFITRCGIYTNNINILYVSWPSVNKKLGKLGAGKHGGLDAQKLERLKTDEFNE